ncbi:MAG TPA: VCBS repeat-containing protein [Candidatus Polarisedimenticolia bacterium]|nr:VCBS repeat-containing protein [Candidatus Polarisedimenticolia bacterium]
MTPRRAAVIAVGIVVLALAVGAGAYLSRPETPVAAAGPPTYVDETESSGLSHLYDGGITFAVGGGVAVFDCDGDRDPDLYIGGGDLPAALFRNVSTLGGPLQFERVASEVTDEPRVNGAYPIDMSGDGIVDLFLLRAGDDLVLQGGGDCAFERATSRFGIPIIEGNSTAFSAKWETGARLPSLAIGKYLKLDEQGTRTLECDVSNVLLPTADGTGYAGVFGLPPGYCALSMLFSDWDRSGHRDLRVTNDREYYVDGMDQLWRVGPVGEPVAYTAADGWVSMQIWGMGIASEDLTGDGYPEVYLTSQADNKLQTLTAGPGQPTFRDIADRRGVTAAQPFTGGDPLPSTAWHPEFADVNNDAFSDLFVSKGNVAAQKGFAVKDPSNLFLGQPDGTFVEGAEQAGILSFDRGRGAALADFNLDGLLDLVLVNYGAPVRLWRNVGTGTAEAPAAMGHWLELAVEDPRSPNRNAIGAWLEIQLGEVTLQRELTIGGGHTGGELGWLHLGLGPTREAKVRVTWPDGEVGPWLSVAADGFAIIERGASAAQRWVPGS